MIYAENILLCIAIPLLITLFFLRDNVRRFAAAFLAGMGVCLISAYITGFIQIVSGMGGNETSIFISPIVEEAIKMLLLLFVLFLFEPEDESYLTVAIGIGAGFATFENCCYILSYGQENISYILIRGLAVGVMHLVTVIASAFVLMMARRFKILTIAGIVGALTVPMIFHALYNLLVSEPGIASYIGYVLPIIAAAGLYAVYRVAIPKNSG